MLRQQTSPTSRWTEMLLVPHSAGQTPKYVHKRVTRRLSGLSTSSKKWDIYKPSVLCRIHRSRCLSLLERVYSIFKLISISLRRIVFFTNTTVHQTGSCNKQRQRPGSRVPKTLLGSAVDFMCIITDTIQASGDDAHQYFFASFVSSVKLE